MLNARQYLISFLATISGNKAVVAGLQQMEAGTSKYAKTTKTAIGRTQSFNDMLTKATKRALIVAPVWMMLRSIMMGFIRTIGDMVRANLDLEEGMARIRTVLHGTSSQIEADMIAIKRQILDTAVNSRASIKDLAEAFYFLQTANLSAEEAMAGFIPTVNAMIGTGNNAKDTARAVAGAYNTMGKFLDENMTITEKFTKIADILTYTYATQDVQLSELVQSYTKLAPYLSGLSDEFGDIVTLLGFLNTRLLRAGRTGRLTGRAILQLTKNAEKLASIFGITFDPNQQINFLDTIKQIHEAMGKTAQITAKQGQALQEVFATRAGVVVRILVSHFEELEETIKLARLGAEGFAEAMNKIRMGTITAQGERMKNIFAVLTNEFVTGAFGADGWTKALMAFNEALKDLAIPAKALGDSLGWLFTNISNGILVLDEFAKKGVTVAEILNPGTIGLKYKEIVEAITQIQHMLGGGIYGFVAPVEYLEEQLDAEKLADEGAEKRNRLAKEDKKIGEFDIQQKKKSAEIIRHTTALLKARGVHQLDIAEAELKSLKALNAFRELTDDEALALAKAHNKVLEKREQHAKQIYKTMQSAGVDLLKAMGASELQILNIKMQQLKTDEDSILPAQFLLQSEKLRLQQAVALQKAKQKELNTASNIYKQYAKANAEERKQIERMLDLVKMTPGELGRAIKDPLDFTVIDKFWQHFSARQKRAMGESLRREFDLDKYISPDVWEARTEALAKYKEEYYEWVRKGASEGEKPVKPIALEDMEERTFKEIAQTFAVDTPKLFWQNWLEEGQRKISELNLENFMVEQGLGKTRPGVWEKSGYENYEERRKIQAQFAKAGITISLGDIHIEVPTSEDIAEEAGKQVKEKLKNMLDSQDIKKRIDEGLQSL